MSKSKFYRACYGLEVYLREELESSRAKARIQEIEDRTAFERSVALLETNSLEAQQKANMLSNSVPVLQEQVRSLQQRVIELEGAVTYEEV